VNEHIKLSRKYVVEILEDLCLLHDYMGDDPEPRRQGEDEEQRHYNDTQRVLESIRALRFILKTTEGAK
jgi:hypothetical protein